jgi:hypothetical protein
MPLLSFLVYRPGLHAVNKLGTSWTITLKINGSREAFAPGGALTKSYWLRQTTALLAVRLIDLFGALLFCLCLHKGRDSTFFLRCCKTYLPTKDLLPK